MEKDNPLSSSPPEVPLREPSERRETKKELMVETFELIAKVVYLLDTHQLWDKDSSGNDVSYTFPDGEVWRPFRPYTEEEQSVD